MADVRIWASFRVYSYGEWQRRAPIRVGALNHSVGIVGVEDELARVHSLLDAARDGSTQTLLIEGEPGIGKTTLLEAAQRIATSFRFLWVRGIESEAVLGHAGLLQPTPPVRSDRGRNPRRRELQATEPLTSQETRVALHAAKGLSNREIAAAHFLSPKTIERHLSSVYRKRGFRSRTELAASFRAREVD